MCVGKGFSIRMGANLIVEGTLFMKGRGVALLRGQDR